MTQQIQFDSIHKDRLFYNQWRYCLRFYLREVNSLKSLNHDYIDAVIQRRKLWMLNTNRWHKNSPTIFNIPDDTIENLHSFADMLINSNVEFQLVTTKNYGWIYTNDRKLIVQLSNNSIITAKKYSEAIINRPKDTVKLKNIKHTHRSYFRGVKLSTIEKQNLVNFFKNQKEFVRSSPALTNWLTTKYTRTQDHFFIDYTSENWLLMISLVCPGLIRKTMEIIPA